MHKHCVLAIIGSRKSKGFCLSLLLLNLFWLNLAYGTHALPNRTFVSELAGVNYSNPVLSRTEAGTVQRNAPSVDESLSHIRQYDFNLVRVPFYWEAFDIDAKAVLAEMELIASRAQQLEIYVIFDFHQYGTSSYFYNNPYYGGFPWSALQEYTFDGGPRAEKKFWNDFYNNDITVDGISLWELQARVFNKIIKRVDNYKSVLGYELLNEPPIYDNSQYEKLGSYHTFMAQKIRSYGSEKFILFNRAYPAWDSSLVDWRYYEKIAPKGVENVIFAPHRYSKLYDGIFLNYQKLSKVWGGVPVILGEWAQGSQEDTTRFVAELKKYGFGWTYWSWKPGSSHDPQRLINSNYEPTVYLSYLSNAYNQFYNTSKSMPNQDDSGPSREVILKADATTTIDTRWSDTNFGHDDMNTVKNGNRALAYFSQKNIENAMGDDQLAVAVLTLQILQNNGRWIDGDREIGVYRVNTEWNKYATTWNCANDTNINNKQSDCNTRWNGGDFYLGPSDIVKITNKQYNVLEFDVTEDVRHFLADDYKNYGWLIKKMRENKSGTVSFDVTLRLMFRSN